MKVIKTKTHVLDKCYSIAPLIYNDELTIAVAAEKINKCMLFTPNGDYKETVWSAPGGTMSIVQVPNSKGQFLATHKFYSPNDSKEARIIIATPDIENNWTVKTLIHLPHVHRFDVISRNGYNYLIAATLCSGRDFKDDWSYKGKVYACQLPDDLSSFNENNQIKMKVIKDELLKNHGYFRGNEDGYNYSVVGSEDGVYKIIPPKSPEEEFEVIQIFDKPASDMTIIDLDNDNNLEMLVFSPFHGANVDLYKIVDNKVKKILNFSENFDFSHAIWSGEIEGRKMILIGNREAQRKLVGIYYEDGKYKSEVYDINVGPANVFSYKHEGKTYIVSANREIDEIAWYEVSK